MGLSEGAYDALDEGERERLALALFDARFEEHRGAVREMFERAGLERVEGERRRLCEAARMVEPNADVHTLLRVTRGIERAFARGALGGAMLTLTMAELVRREAEEVFERELPEEDELGPSLLSPEQRRRAKRGVYGTHRVLDDEEASRDFVRAQGVDAGARVRWYVEGETEYGAIPEAFGGPRGDRRVEPINLKAQFGRRKKNRLDDSAFRARLRRDVGEGVFSFVSLDADDQDTMRVARAAVEAGDLFGACFVGEPDFERGNFLPEELAEVLWRWAREDEDARGGPPEGAREGDKNTLLEAVEGAQSGKEFFDRAHGALYERLGTHGKGAEWGRRLLAYAAEKPEGGSGEERPIVGAVRSAYRAADANYTVERRTRRMDARTGRLTPKE